jgi:hypothetical protein
VRHVGGNASEAASIYNSKEGWAREIVDDFNAKYFQRMEHQLMKQSEPGLASDSGFHTATSTMAKHHDAAVDKMTAPSHATFESERDSLKEMSGVRDVNQDIQTQKETFKSEKNDIQQNLKTSLKNQKESLEAQRRNLKEEYRESDNEWIGKKAGRATFIPSALSKPKMSDTDKKKD